MTHGLETMKWMNSREGQKEMKKQKPIKKVFITGGAGYIGTTLTEQLLENGYEVTIYDRLMYDGSVLLPFYKYNKFKFIDGDVMDKEHLTESMKGFDCVIHLAAIVGYFACEKNKELSKTVNVIGTQNVIDAMTDEQYLLFGSTGSNYGKVEGICTEESKLNPSSLYGVTKTEAEEMVMTRKNSTAYRFATAFGVSHRLRLDLLTNDLTYKALTDKYLVIYQPSFMRTFIHVRDIARSFLFAIENKHKMIGEVYNVGSNKLNYSKRDVCEMIKERTDCYINYNDFDSDKDNRDYEVSYDKLHELGFDVTISLEEGLDELVNVFKVMNFEDKRYKNTAFPKV